MPDHSDPLAQARLFMASRVILTAAELDVFTRLDADPDTSAGLAASAGLDPRGTARLLDCLAAIGLLAKREGAYRLTPDAAALSSRHPESVLPVLLHQVHLWGNWSHLAEAVRLGRTPGGRPATASGPETLRAFIGAMHVVGRALSREIAAGYDASRFARLLDVGGGSGTYTIAFLERNPSLKAVLFDLPEVVEMAGERLEREGLLARVELVPGDFYRDELPEGCDLALLSAIVHQNGPEQNVELFRKVHRALRPGGALIVRDHVMDEDRTHPPQGAFFALNMLVGTAAGDTYTFAELEAALARAGFASARLVRRGDRMDGLVEARR